MVKNRDNFLKKGVLLISALVLIFLLNNPSQLFSKNQHCLKQLYFYQNKLKVSLHLSQVRLNLLNVCALPTLSKNFGRGLTSPYKWLVIKRISPRENFVKKVPPFLSFTFIYFYFHPCPFCHFPLFKGFPGQQEVHLTIQGR